MAGFILRGLIAALGLWAATEMLDGITINSATTLIIAGLLLGVVNAIVRPFALLLSCRRCCSRSVCSCWWSTRPCLDSLR